MKKHNKRDRASRSAAIVLPLLGALAGAAAMPAFAQEASTQEPQQAPQQQAPAQAPLDTIDRDRDVVVVTAQGRDQSMQDVPISMSVVDGESLQESNITTLSQINQLAPGLRISTATGSDLINIRGTGSGLNAGFEQSVSTFVNGIYRPRARLLRASMLDLARVEVLKGPQTTLFGANASAGAISITTNGPTNDFTGYASAYYEPEYGGYNVEGAVGGPLIDDVLSYRAAGRLSGSDGYVYNEKLRDDGPNLDTQQARFALRFTPNSAVTIDAHLDYVKNRDTLTNPYEVVGCPPPPGSGPPTGQCLRNLTIFGDIDDVADYRNAQSDSYSNLDYWEAGVIADVQLGDYTLRTISGYAFEDFDTKSEIVPMPGLSPVGTQSYLPFRVPEKYQQYSQEVRLLSPEEWPVSFIVGGYLEHNSLSIHNRIGYYFLPLGSLTPGGAAIGLTATTPIGSRVGMRQVTDSSAVFGSATWRVTDALKATLSARYVSIDKEADRYALMGLSNDELTAFTPLPPAQSAAAAAVVGVATTGFATPSRSDSKFLPALNLTYQLTDDVMAYFSYSEGFKSGGYDGTPTNSVFDPESVTAYEGGLKTELFDRRVTANIAIFNTEYRDLQESAIIQLCPTCATVAQVSNAAESRARGAEVETLFHATDWLSFSASATYLESIYTDFPNGACTALGSIGVVGCRQDLSGRPRPFAPRFSGNLGFNVNYPIGDNLEFDLSGLVYHTSSYYFSPTLDPLLKQEAYTTIDLQMGIGAPDEQWRVALIAKNLTDENTATYMSIVSTTQGSVSRAPDLPRTIGVQLSTRW